MTQVIKESFSRWWNQYTEWFINGAKLAEEAYTAGFEAGWEKHREMMPGPGK
jgi:hypothetical protein